MSKPQKPYKWTDAQWHEYLIHFTKTYESYRVGACVWLCRRGHDECVEADWLQTLAHDYLLRYQDAPLPA